MFVPNGCSDLKIQTSCLRHTQLWIESLKAVGKPALLNLHGNGDQRVCLGGKPIKCAPFPEMFLQNCTGTGTQTRVFPEPSCRECALEGETWCFSSLRTPERRQRSLGQSILFALNWLVGWPKMFKMCTAPGEPPSLAGDALHLLPFGPPLGQGCRYPGWCT